MVGDSLIWFIPQTRWLCDEVGKLMTSDLLRFESLSDDWDRFCQKYNFRAPLKHLNRTSSGQDYMANYNAETRAIIDDYFASDFTAFNY